MTPETTHLDAVARHFRHRETELVYDGSYLHGGRDV